MNGVLTVYLEHTYSKRREQKGHEVCPLQAKYL